MKPDTDEIVCSRTARRLSRLARDLGLEVSVLVCSSTRPKRRWYSVGFNSATGWHQCEGYKYPENAEAALHARAERKQATDKLGEEE